MSTANVVTRVPLEPCFDSRKSFYGKAMVESFGGVDTLYSYGVKVAEVHRNEYPARAVVIDTYSATTLRHIKEFLKQNGFTVETKSQVVRDYSQSVRY